MAIGTALLLSMLLVPQDRPRARDLGLTPGSLAPGTLDAITDVPGVRVGHATVVEGDAVRTGVTVVVPHGGNVFQEKVPAAIVVGNGFGKLIGSTQVHELGELETPIALTNTLDVGGVAEALVAWTLEQPGNEAVRSVNAVVGETNDGRLNDIRGQHVTAAHVRAALAAAHDGAVEEGSVGAGTGTVCFGWKGGIGTASRQVGDFVVGVLVQSNFGGRLTMGGVPLQDRLTEKAPRDDRDGSCMIVIATDAPLDVRNLDRLAKRAFAGMARTGASFSNGSGDYAIAFCTATSQRIHHGAERTGGPVLANAAMTPLFVAVADATEEAIYDSLLQATTVESSLGRAEAIPVDRLRALLAKRR